MGPEYWVGLVAVFFCGGAVGTVGTLLSQWMVRKLAASAPEPPAPTPLGRREAEILRSEVADLGRMVQNLDARLEFQEQLLAGGLPVTQPPPRLPEAGNPPEARGETES